MAFEDLAFDPSTPAPSDEGVSWGDYLKTLGAGTAAVGGGLAAATRQFYEAGRSENGAKLSKAIQDAFGGVEEGIRDTMGDEAKKRLSASITSEDFWNHPGSAAALKLTNMAPMVAATLIPGGIMSEAIGATLATAAAGGAINAGLVEKEIYEKTDKLSDEELQEQVPFYAGLRSVYDETEARRQFNAKRMGMAPAINFVLGAAAGAVGPAASIARGLKGGPAVLGAGEAGAVGRGTLGAVEGGVTNAVQAVGGDVTAQAADMGEDSFNQPFDARRTIDAALEGTAAGALLGGIAGAASGGKAVPAKAGERVDSPAAVADFTNKGMKITDPAAPDANPSPVKPTIEEAVLGVQPKPQVKEGATGTPSKPVDDPAVVGNVQNAPVRGSRDGAKDKVASAEDSTVTTVAETGPDTAQTLAIDANKDPTPNSVAPEPVPNETQKTNVSEQVTPEVTAEPTSRPPAESQQEVTSQVTEPPTSVQPAPPEAFSAFAPVAEAAPAGPPRTGRVLPNLAQAAEAAANTKAQNEIIQRNIKSAQLTEPKGKNLSSKDSDKIAATIKAAEDLVAKYPPTDGETNYTRDVNHRDAVVRRAQEIVATAEREGIKIPTRIKPSVKGNQAGDSPHVQMLRYAADLARVAKTQAKGKKLTDAVIRFKEREDAYRTGASEEALAARRSEGEAARRADQGDVETHAAAPENEAGLSPEELLIRKQEEEGAEPPTDVAPAPAPKPEAPPKKTFSPAVEKARAAAKALAEKRAAEEKPAASEVRRPKLSKEELDRILANSNKKTDRSAMLAAEESAASRYDARPREMPDRNPTVKQREAGNYRKGHVRVHGLDVTVETARGMIRRATDGSWKVRMPEHYGYIKRTTGADGDHVDAYVGRHKDSDRVFVIDQLDHRTGKFDEHKVMLNFKDEAEAVAQYEKAFSDGNGRARLGNIHEMNPAEFKQWLREGDTTEPVTKYAHTEIPSGELLLPIDERKGQIAWSERSSDARTELEKIDFSHIGENFGLAKAIAPYIKKRLLQLVGDTPVHYVTDANMKLLRGSDKYVYGIFKPDRRSPDTDGAIYLNTKDPTQVAQTLIHEATHRAMLVDLERSPAVKELVRDMMDVTDQWVKDNAPGHYDEISYAFKNEHEFLAEAFSNPMVQHILELVPAPPNMVKALRLDVRSTFWQALKQMARNAIEKLVGPVPHFDSILDASIRAGEHVFVARQRRMQSERGAPVREYARENIQSMERSVTEGVKELFKRPEAHTMENAPKLLKLRTFDNIAQMADHFWGENNPVRKVYEAAQKIHVSAQSYLKDAEPAVKKLYDAMATSKPEEFTALSNLLHDATMANVHPDVALTDPKNAHLGKNRLNAVQSKARHADLAERYKALPPKLKEAYHDAVKFFTDQQNKLAYDTLRNRMRELGHDDDALAKRVFDEQLTDADRTRLGDALPLLEDAKELSKIQGPYVPLMRRGDHVVIGEYAVKKPPNGKEIARNEFEFNTRKEAEEYAAKNDLHAEVRSVWVDKTTGKLHGVDPKTGKEVKITSKDVQGENKFRVTLQDQHVEFFNGKKAAEVAAANLAKAGVTIRTVEPRKPDAVGNPQFMPGQTASLLAALKKRQSYKDATATMKADMEKAVREAGIQMLASTRIQSRHLPRRHVEGASRDIVQNMFDYAASTSRTLAKLEHAPAMESALKQMESTIEQDATKLRNYARRAISNEVVGRIKSNEAYSDNDSASPVVKRLLAVSFLDKLASPAYSVINAMQPSMVTMPYLAGNHGVARAFAAMSRAYSDIGAGSVVKKGLAETGRAIRGNTKPDDFISDIKSRLKSEDERRMIDEHVKLGTIDPSAGMEIAALIRDRSGIGGKIDTGIGYLEGIAREMPRAVEAVNRAVTALASYRLERSRGASHEAAVRYSQDAVSNTQFNYSPANAPAIFNHPLAKLALQFKKYGQGMYQLIGTQIGRAIRNENPGDRAKAVKTLAGIAATHMAAAGALGLPTEPFKYLVMGTSFATGVTWQDVENKIREAAAELFGKTGGEVATRGLPRLLNVDMSRMGLDSVTSFGEPQTMKENDVLAWMFKSLSGPVASLIGDWTKGASKLANGEFVKGAELIVPMKGAADSIRAYRQATEGKKSATGRETMSAYTPSEAALRALGFGSGREAEIGAARGAYYNSSNAQKERRAELITAAAQAKGGDKVKAMTAIAKFNKDVPEQARIKPKDIASKVRSLTDDDMVMGIKADKKNKYLLDRARGAYNTGE